MEDAKKETRKKNLTKTHNISTQLLAEHGKVQPQAIDLEEAVLGAMMLEKDAVSAVIDILSPAVFYKDNHKKIMGAIASLFAKSVNQSRPSFIQSVRNGANVAVVAVNNSLNIIFEQDAVVQANVEAIQRGISDTLSEDVIDIEELATKLVV